MPNAVPRVKFVWARGHHVFSLEVAATTSFACLFEAAATVFRHGRGQRCGIHVLSERPQ